MDIQL